MSDAEVKTYRGWHVRTTSPREWPGWLVRLAAARFYDQNGEALATAVPNPSLLLMLMEQEGLTIVESDGTTWKPDGRDL